MRKKRRKTKYQKIGIVVLSVSVILFCIFLGLTVFFKKIVFLAPAVTLMLGIVFPALIVVVFCTSEWEENQASKEILDYIDHLDHFNQ